MDELPWADHQLVFVGGLHRSGTSLVESLLSGHPSASGLTGTGAPEDEGQHLQDVYPTARALGGPGRFALSPQSHLTDDSPWAVPSSAPRLFDAWSPFWDLSKPVLVEKSPPNLMRSRFLQALFPAARFVMVVRHPVEVSLATEKWTPDLSFSRLLEHWFVAHDRFEKDRGRIGQILVVRYERLLAEPSRVLAELAAFTGLEGLTDNDAIDATVHSTYGERWQDRIDREGSAWLGDLTDRFGTRAAAYGYRLDDLSTLERGQR